MNNVKKYAVAIVALSLTACSTANMNNKRETIKNDLLAATSRAKSTAEAIPYSSVVSVEGFYVSHKTIKITPKSNKLPSAFNKKITMVERDKIGLLTFTEKVTQLTGIPVVVATDVINAMSASAEEPLALLPTDSTLPPGDVAPVAVDSGSSARPAGSWETIVQYSGSLSGLLNVISAKMNLFWRYSDGQIILYQYDTRTFMVNAIPGSTRMSAEITNSSGGSSEAGGDGDLSPIAASTGHSVTMSSDLSAWDDIENTVESMLSEDGRSVASDAIGLITVTDTPIVLSSIKKYMDSVNEVMGRQVMVGFKIYSVELDDEEAYGIDWSLLHRDISSSGASLGIELGTSALSAIAGSGDLTATILRPSSNWSNSEAVLRALNKQGNVSIKTSTSILTLNNQPVPVQVANQTTYLASSTGAVDSTGGGASIATTGLEPGTVTTGFSLNVLPRIVSNEELLLQYSIDLSTLDSIETISSGGQSIQAPRISTRNFMQRVGMKSGETLILTGFESTEDSYNTSGLAPGDFGSIFGGVNSAKGRKSVTVVVVTPLIMPGVEAR